MVARVGKKELGLILQEINLEYYSLVRYSTLTRPQENLSVCLLELELTEWVLNVLV